VVAPRLRIAVVGTGIAGNYAAWRLAKDHDVTVFEAGSRIGGHTNTVDVDHNGRQFAVDTGFIVYNDATYPNFLALLDELGVEGQESTMSFSVRCERTGLEYNGANFNSLFAQRRNLLRPSFWRMLKDILRFNREAPALLGLRNTDLTLNDYLCENGYSRPFIEHYIIPMGAAIWSATPDGMGSVPAGFFVRFFHNHGLLSIGDRPTWRVIRGGSRQYLEKLVAGHRDRIHLNAPVQRILRYPDHVLLKAAGHPARRFDKVFIATHSDQAAAMLADASTAERQVLGSIAYQKNEAVLHTDETLMPRHRRAWAAWNYRVPPGLPDGSARTDQRSARRVALTYNMNILQSLDSDTQFLVTLNHTDAIDPACIIKTIEYEHPIFNAASLAAQARHREINGARHTYFCGAYWRYGFHEDGVVSAIAALDHLADDLQGRIDVSDARAA
jgi:predicted NAD/FAD-binding protein